MVTSGLGDLMKEGDSIVRGSVFLDLLAKNVLDEILDLFFMKSLTGAGVLSTSSSRSLFHSSAWKELTTSCDKSRCAMSFALSS